MARTLTGNLTSAVAGIITAPGYLVYLGFSPVLRYSTRGQVTWGGQTWLSDSGVRVDEVSPEHAMLTLRNHDNAASALMFNNNLSDIVCSVYKLYGSDAVILFIGFLEMATSIGDMFVTVTASSRAAARSVPDEYIGSTKFNHILPSGTEISWGGTVIVLE